MKEDTATGKPRYHGKFSCTNFNLGKFFASEKYIGNITMNGTMDGKGLKKEDANVSMDGKINSFECNGYNYHNMDVKGTFAKNIFNGVLAVKDDNLILDFNGNMDFSKSPTVVDITSYISKANLSKLNLLKSGDEYIGLTAKIDVNAVGNNMDDVTGTMNLNDVVYLKGADVFDFKNLELTIEDKAGIKIVKINSSVADAKLTGKFKPLEMASCLNDFLANYLPSYIPRMEAHVEENTIAGKSKRVAEHLQKFNFSVQLKNTDDITRAFIPSLTISTLASMSGNYDEEKNNFSFSASFPQVSVNGYKFRTGSIKAATDKNFLTFNTTFQRVELSDSVWIDGIRIASTLANDTMNFNLKWNTNTGTQYVGDIPGFVSFSEKPKVKLSLLPSSIPIADSIWNINSDNEVMIDSSFIRIKNLDFICGRQQVKVEGTISKVKEDKMYLILSSFSLANFNSFLRGTGFAVYGTISGNTSIGNIYDNPIFGSSMDIHSMKVNNELIGDGNLLSVYDSQKEMIAFNGGFIRDEVGNMKFSGNYYPSKKDSSIEMDAEVHNFRMEFFEPFIKGNLENLKGVASAELKINGTPGQPQLTGIVKTKVDNAFVNYLGTNYHFEGDIRIEPTSFDFSNLTIYDVNQNSAKVINGKIFHANFKNFQMDFDMKTDKLLCLNTTEKDNSIYYGKFFATGIMNVFGYFDNINLSANVKTDKAKNSVGKYEYTQLFIPLSGSEEVSENSFISFVKNDTATKVKPPKYKVNTTGFTMDFKLEATPDAQVQLIFDEKVGDIIKASGKGNIEMKVNEFGDFKMYGDYTVEGGDYLFTLKNVVNKKFRLENGGTLRWSGNPEQAEINMNAVYEVRSSLTPLFYEHEQTEATRKRHPVDLLMNLSGKLLEPDIIFDVRLPTVDDFTRQQSYDRFKNSDLEVNRQVFSLLFTNSFTTPSGLNREETVAGPNAGAVTSSEVLSNQLSNWLSQISNEFDVGVHYRPGDRLGEGVNKDEVELALSTQLFNDKISIDGSVANNSNTTSNNPSAIVGDINIDYKLTDNGKVRAKAFNKANEGDISTTQKGPYTQGVGIFYKEEFETVGELFRRFLGKKKKKKNNAME
ncbi:MAG: translocation/assembly module TamB domain-containing protein [Bacteroidota bacterium]